MQFRAGLNLGEGEMFAVSLIVLRGIVRKRQRTGFRLIGLERVIDEALNLAGVGIKNSELGPAIADDVGDVGVVIDDLEHGFGSGFDEEQESDGFVNIDALPWESGSEVAGGAIHNTEEGGDIMGQLCAAPPATVINGGELSLIHI